MTIESIEDTSGRHCVDLKHHPEGGCSFKVFRKDPEDEGRWTLVGDYSGVRHATADAALRAAMLHVPWLAEALAAAARRTQ